MPFGTSSPLSSSDRRVLWAWSLFLASVYICIALFFLPKIRSYRQEADRRHDARLNPLATEPGLTAADLSVAPGAARVHTGIYVDRVSALSVHEAQWSVDFHLWFRWENTLSIRPDEGFHVVDGAVESSDLLVDRVEGTERYVRYRVAATITKAFDASRFPCDDHLLTINIENGRHQRSELVLVVDESATGVSSRVRVPGYIISRHQAIEKPHSYSTSLGDPEAAQLGKATFSQLRMGIWIGRPSWGFYFKLFQALYVSVLIAMLALFIRPTNLDPRFGLGIGGLFAAVANNYVSSSLIPDTGVMTLADLINFLGILTVFLTVLQSTLSLYVFERWGSEELSRRLDRWSFAIILVLYPLLNVLLPWVAGG